MLKKARKMLGRLFGRSEKNVRDQQVLDLSACSNAAEEEDRFLEEVPLGAGREAANAVSRSPLEFRATGVINFGSSVIPSSVCNLLRSGPMDNNVGVPSAREVRAEAHRKLALAEWLAKMEARRIALEESNQDGMQVGELTWFVKQRKQQLATAEEYLPLQLNAVSGSLPSSVSSELERFDHYLELPDLVFEKIICFLEDPQDMLNLLEAIPTQAKYSKRTKADLHFELVEFPEMLRSGRVFWELDVDAGDGIDDMLDVDVRELASRSKHHLKVILRHFENFLVNDITKVHGGFTRGTEHLCYLYRRWAMEDSENIQPWHKFPETYQMTVYSNKRNNLSYLETGGRAIWDFKICLDQPPHALEYAWGNLIWYLSFMPNLRNLYLCFNFEEHEDEELENSGNNSDVLPELPFLKSLQFHVWRKPNVFPTFIMLLEKYGRQLNQLWFETLCLLEDIPVELPPCPKLANLVIGNRYMARGPETNSEMVLQLLSNFDACPLKILKLVMVDTRERLAFYQVLEFISLKFGGTLEHLEIEIAHGYRWRTVEIEPPSTSYTLLDSVHLPKLKHFRTNVDPKPDGWGYLLLFPTLVSLYVDRFEWCEDQDTEDDEVTFSDVDGVKRSKLWEWLLCLEIIEIMQGTVTREEALNSIQ